MVPERFDRHFDGIRGHDQDVMLGRTNSGDGILESRPGVDSDPALIDTGGYGTLNVSATLRAKLEDPDITPEEQAALIDRELFGQTTPEGRPLPRGMKRVLDAVGVKISRNPPEGELRVRPNSDKYLKEYEVVD
jgi:hypothetical protein